MRKVSVVVPCYNEEQVIGETHRRLSGVLAREPYPAELIFVDDGSRDRTLCLLREIAAGDPAVKVISLSRNFGHQAAVSAGLRYSTGTEAVVIDADLQDPPEAIPGMLALLDRERCGVVYGERMLRKGERLFKRATAHAFYALLNSLSEVKFPLDAGDFRVMDRSVIDAFLALPERNKYIRGLVGWIGFRQAPFPYEREPRFAGQSKYTLAKMVKLAADGLFSFSRKPLRLVVRLGTLSVLAAAGLAGWALLRRLIWAQATIPGWTSTVAIVLVLGGVQLLCSGTLGEYVGAIFDESKHRPEYIVAEAINMERGEKELSAAPSGLSLTGFDTSHSEWRTP